MPRRYQKMKPLTQKGEEALRATIKDWERVGGRVHASFCHLCGLLQCDECPVDQRTGYGCTSHRFLREWYSTWDGTPEAERAARKIRRFLRDTLRLGIAAREREAK